MSINSARNSETPAGRLLGLDVGTKRIGVALSDPLQISARPLTTLVRTEKTMDRLADLISEWEVRTVVIGRPLRLDGSRSPILDTVEKLAAELETRLGVSIRWADERLSSKEAEHWMSREGIPPARRRQLRDQYAATLILQWYLEASRG